MAGPVSAPAAVTLRRRGAPDLLVAYADHARYLERHPQPGAVPALTEAA